MENLQLQQTRKKQLAKMKELFDQFTSTDDKDVQKGLALYFTQVLTDLHMSNVLRKCVFHKSARHFLERANFYPTPFKNLMENAIEYYETFTITKN